ncbi:MAG: hypothetical protein ACRDDF_10900, partial [Aeromonas sp.]
LKLNLNLFYNLMHDNVAIAPLNLTTVNRHKYNIRSSSITMKTARARTDSRHNFFLNRYSRIWNSLSLEVKSRESSGAFGKVNQLFPHGFQRFEHLTFIEQSQHRF